MLFQREHRKHCGEAGGADRHRLARRHAARQAHQPVALDARLLGVSAEMGLAHAPAGTDHLVAGLPLRMRRLLDGAREVDARDHGKTPSKPPTWWLTKANPYSVENQRVPNIRATSADVGGTVESQVRPVAAPNMIAENVVIGNEMNATIDIARRK